MMDKFNSFTAIIKEKYFRKSSASTKTRTRATDGRSVPMVYIFQPLDHIATEEIKESVQVGNEFYQSLYVRAHDWSLSFHNFL